MLGELFNEEFVIGEENFHEGSAEFSIIIKKNNEKINVKSFFNWKKGAALKLKTNINYYPYERLTSF